MSTKNEPESDREIVNSRVFDCSQVALFEAWSDPTQLSKWWGPKGFTNTFEEFQFRPGGDWKFVMHGPDGKDYRNESRFVTLERPNKIVFNHLRPMHRFEVTATFEDAGKHRTRLTFRMLFGTIEECDRVRNYVPASNEQNFDRLEQLMKRTETIK